MEGWHAGTGGFSHDSLNKGLGAALLEAMLDKHRAA